MELCTQQYAVTVNKSIAEWSSASFKTYFCQNFDQINNGYFTARITLRISKYTHFCQHFPGAPALAPTRGSAPDPAGAAPPDPRLFAGRAVGTLHVPRSLKARTRIPPGPLSKILDTALVNAFLDQVQSIRNCPHNDRNTNIKSTKNRIS